MGVALPRCDASSRRSSRSSLIVVLNFVLFRMMPGSPERVLAAQPERDRGDARGRPASAGASTSRSSRTSSSRTSARRSRATSATRSRTAASRWPRSSPAGSGRRSSCSASARSSRSSSGSALGAYSGWRRGGPVDYVGNGVSLILYSMPYFVIGMVLLIDLRAGLGWFPTSGCSTVGAAVRHARSSSSSTSCRHLVAAAHRPWRSG